MDSRVNGRRLMKWLFIAITLFLAIEAFHSGWSRYYNADEFRYAHAAWLFSQGSFPYLDYWDVKTPLFSQATSLVFVFGGDDPGLIRVFRLFTLMLLAVNCAAGYLINRRSIGSWAAVTPAAVLSIGVLVFMATEVRPDALSVALYLSAVALLYFKESRPRVVGYLVGLLWLATLWSAQKALFYDSVFVLAFAIDVLVNVRRRRGYLLGSPWFFLGGAATGAALVLAYLVLTASLGACYEHCIRFTLLKYDEFFPALPKWPLYQQLLDDAAWLAPFFVWGVVSSIRSLLQDRERLWSNPEIVALASVPLTFLVFHLQKGPFLYSLLPFMMTSSIFAVRGAVFAARFAVQLRPALRRNVWLGVFVMIMLAHLMTAYGSSGLGVSDRMKPTNKYQHRVLALLARLTWTRDPVYDNTGGYITRPHAYSPYFTYQLLRKLWADKFTREVPAAILESECTVMLLDVRFWELSHALKMWLMEHFVPHGEDLNIYLWGKRFKVPESGRIESRFTAVRRAEYSVRPKEALHAGTLTIDGNPIAAPVMSLDKGEHSIGYVGAPGTYFELVWVPRDGRPAPWASPQAYRPFSYIRYR